MPQATKECRVCGKTYTACNTNRHFDGSFHWREVACSPDCGKVYLQRIMESRGEKAAEPAQATQVAQATKVAQTAEPEQPAGPKRSARRSRKSSFFAARDEAEDGKDSTEKE